MTFLAKNNLKALYGLSSYDSPDMESYAASPLNTMPFPLKQNDPVRRKLHPWFEDFEFYRFGDTYIIYYTADKGEIYVTHVDLLALRMLLINVNLENHKMTKKAKRYVRHPEIEWKIVAAYCMAYGERVTKKEASDMTIFMTRIKEEEIQVIAPHWRKVAQEMSEQIDRSEKECLRSKIDELREDRDKWRGKYVKAEHEKEQLKLHTQSLTKPKKCG